MKDYKCFEIEFPGIEFDQYFPSSEKIEAKHHAHIYQRENEIEIRILYDSITYFGNKFGRWVKDIHWKSFGKYIQVSNENQNTNLHKIDFAQSSLIGLTINQKQIEGNLEYLSVKIDSVRFYWEVAESSDYSAEFYFNEAGFKAVEEFYYPMSDNEGGGFNISRRKGMDEYYNLGKGRFRPEFDFNFSDSIYNSSTTITKEPKLVFQYSENIQEAEAILYGEIFRIAASFYFHLDINYTYKRIQLKEYTIGIRRVFKSNYYKTADDLSGFHNYWDFPEFLQSNWQESTLKNYKKLSKVVELFNQSHKVDQSSKFLIRYNIIEIIKGGEKDNPDTFKQIVEPKDMENKCQEALKLLLETIDPNEQEDFKIKWNSVTSQLKYKPMTKSLKMFFERKNLSPSTFPISIKRLNELRNNLVHGSLNENDFDILENANFLMYRITGILILQLMGIDNWELNTKLKE